MPTQQQLQHQMNYRRLVGGLAAFDPDLPQDAARIDVPELIDALTELLTVLALVQARRTNWVPDQQHPGYLTHSLEGATMKAPFHLATGLPGSTVLAELRSIASTIKIGSDSAMCLSGSAVTLAKPQYFGDLDFCEYVPSDEAERSLDRLVALALDNANGATCTEIRIREQKIVRPWKDDCSSANMFGIYRIQPGAVSGKADFVFDTRVTGPIEVTNTVVWVDRQNSDQEAATLSFPYQEIDVGILSEPWIPRRLNLPTNLARYIRFLKDDIAKYRHQRPVKALKRALSLASFMLLADRRKAILELARDAPDLVIEARNQRTAVVMALREHKDTALRDLAPRMELSLDRWLTRRRLKRHQCRSRMFAEQADVLIEQIICDVAATPGQM